MGQSNQIAVLTPEDIERLVLQTIALAGKGSPDEPMTLQEAAQFLNIKPDILSRLSHEGKVPCQNLGMGVKANFRYSKNALSAWLAGERDK